MKCISFAVCCYNSQAYMETCIDSLLAGKDEVEIIIVDDGSKDTTGEIADSYQAKYPSIVKVIHQPNGGHGEGINQALKIATGKYFKVVDSDDWVVESTLKYLLGIISENKFAPDLFVTEYDYHYGRGNIVKKINYSHVFKSNKLLQWKDTKQFDQAQYLTIHSCMFRTEMMQGIHVDLPKHVYYEDNLFIYKGLPLVNTIVYINLPFYCYLVGRAGQSVSKDVSVRRYKDYIEVSRQALESNDIYQYKKTDPKKFRALYHHARMLFVIAVLHTRMNKSPEAKKDLAQFYSDIKQNNPKLFRRLRHHSLCSPITYDNGFGKMNANILYWLAHRVVKFN